MKSLYVVALWGMNLLVDSAGHLAFKAAAIENDTATGWAHWRHMLARPWLWVGIVCFIAEFVLWLAFLSVVPLSQGVLLGMLSIVIIMIGGRIWFHEHFTRLRVIGVALIVLGVALVGGAG
ncbi:EamA family transporter [Uliginosibacterium gangwonense]|uniref:EamA family transporter n=1 Tax=Uliginosibacterium gangwonense TaxID=392736 RepID=UPI00047541BA|nr:EamA family transporter [Uliginosibacterium gangwonense]